MRAALLALAFLAQSFLMPSVSESQAGSGAGQASAAPPAAAQIITITAVRVSGWENLAGAAADSAPWIRGLIADWTEAYGSRAGLSDARPSGQAGALAAELEVAITAAGFRTLVSLAAGPGRRLEARASIHGHQEAALRSSLAGDLFFLWNQAGGFELPPARAAPSLGACLALDSLRLLPGWRPETGEPLDCAASAEGPVLLFSDRLLALGRNLDVAPATAGDLLLRAPIPPGFRPDRLWLDPLGRAVLFSAATGEILSYVDGLPPERRQTGLRQPVHAALLPRGGLAVVASGRISRALRQGGGLRREQLPLPGGFYGAVEGDSGGRLWVLDLVERRVRILDERGQEVRSLKPTLDPSLLPFPQVFLPLSDGGLLLGGEGQLWRFDRWGVSLWRMQSVFTLARETLPSYFRVALAPLQAEAAPRGAGTQGPAFSPCTLYLLDPAGRRLFRFDDTEPAGPGGSGGGGGGRGGGGGSGGSGSAGAGGSAGAAGAEPGSQLPALLALLEAGGVSIAEVAQYAADQGLPLVAQTFLRTAQPDGVARLARLAKVRLLRGLVELADQAENELRLPEAEAGLREAARLTGELKAVDPAEPSYARDLPALVARRTRLREELLEPGEQSLQAELEPAGPGGGQPVLSLRNASGLPVESVSVQLRWAGFPPGPGVEGMQPVRSGYQVRLPLPLPPSLEGYAEELTVCLSVLVSWRQQGQSERRFLQAACLLPPAP